MNNSTNIQKTLGANVKALRVNKNLTQEQLAEYLGLQPHSVTKIETGRAFVSSKVLAKISDFFNVTPAYLFSNKVKIITEDDLKYSDAIKKLLPNFSATKLREIYNILSVMDNK